MQSTVLRLEVDIYYCRNKLDQLFVFDKATQSDNGYQTGKHKSPVTGQIQGKVAGFYIVSLFKSD